MDLSIVIPAYNEEKRILIALDKAIEFLRQREWSYELLPVDDGSADRTVAVIEEYAQDNETLRVSRMPTYQGENRDDVTGFVLKDDLLAAVIAGNGSEPISSLRRDIMIVKEDFPLPDLFQRLVSRRQHIAPQA